MPEQSYCIYLVFSKTGTWLSRALKYFQPSKYVHTSIGFDETFNEMYSFGRINPKNPFSGGFVKESLYEGVYKNNPSSECQIFKVPVTLEQYEGLKKDIEYFHSTRDRYRYNFIGLFGVLFNRPIHRKNHYFCSQFVYILLKKHHILDVGKQPELVQTIDLFELKNKILIYEGLIVDMERKAPPSSLININNSL
ncbi:hypothetical protein QE109_07595 [Fusibacter bizertensis]|uniref:Permuted papain-like amidase enzyme, YaeF/YiiX, C92 family n=1 Tax=Fusibacter bizertensis TaxID=1488331 RepID=A0ABT6NC59_9FIRM|nr:hypothetical protein [Fusibacter bizertensis]MDH8678007.1 hypothetical protein [Fusibacter bizertensis]